MRKERPGLLPCHCLANPECTSSSAKCRTYRASDLYLLSTAGSNIRAFHFLTTSPAFDEMQLLDLPNEILQLCCPGTDLDKLRLTCKRFAIMASKPLFAHVRLLPTTQSAAKLQSIIENESLAALVESITLQASTMGPGRCDEDEPAPIWNVDLGVGTGSEDGRHNTDNEYGIEPDDGCDEEFISERELSTIFKQTLHEIGRFSNLRSLELIYNDYVGRP